MICLFGDDEQQYTNNDIAWMEKDWAKVQEIADTFKEKPENELFMLLNQINSTKTEMCVDNIEGYSKFMIDNMLSRHVDAIQEAYISNMFMQGLSDQAHYNYMINAVSKGKRFSKSTKLDEPFKDKFINMLLMKYYKVNIDKAIEYKTMLTHKNVLADVLKKCKGFVTDDFLKSITKNVKEQKELKKLL